MIVVFYIPILNFLILSHHQKLYDKEMMEAYYKEKESEPAHLVKQKTMYTTYRHDNAFDRVALSQLTAGEKPGTNIIRAEDVSL